MAVFAAFIHMAFSYFQVDVCRSLMKELATNFGLESEDASMIEAGVLSRAGKTEEAVKILMKEVI